jgi:hypothetical protein
MKKLYILTIIIFFYNCSNDNSSSSDDCFSSQEIINTDLNISRITFTTQNGELVKEYIIGSNNRISNSINYDMSEINNIYAYNECNQLIRIDRIINGSEPLNYLHFFYDDQGQLIETIHSDFRYEYEYQENKVTYSEYRPVVNTRRELTFDENDNAVKEVDFLANNLVVNVTYDSNGNWVSSDWDSVDNYSLEYQGTLNPFYLINVNSFGRLNHLIYNYGFNQLREPGANNLVEGGLARNLLLQYDSDSGNTIYDYEVLETTNGYATKYMQNFNSFPVSVSVVIEIEFE